MFKLTDSASEIIRSIINKEKNTEDEELFLRLSVGIG